MHDIEYRVWDKSKKKMSKAASIHFGDDGAALTIIVEPAPKGRYYEYLVHGESGELMRYTGIKDKNGVKIFDGDIVKIKYVVGDWAWVNMTPEEIAENEKQDGKQFVCEVIWDKHFARFELLYGDPNSTHMCFPMSYSSEGIVIGNIYEENEPQNIVKL